MYKETAFSYLENLYEFGTSFYSDLEPVELDKLSALIIKEMQQEHEFDDYELLSLISDTDDFSHNIIGMLLNDKYSNTEKNKEYTEFVLNNIKQGCHDYTKKVIEKYFDLIKDNRGLTEPPQKDLLGDAYEYNLRRYRDHLQDSIDEANAA